MRLGKGIESILRSDKVLRMGTWNLENAGLSKLEKDECMDLITRTIRHDFDFIAIQEIENIEFLDALMSRLGPKYDFRTIESGRTRSSDEFYTFIFREKKVEVSPIKITRSKYAEEILRPPAYVKIKAGHLEANVYNIHTTYKSENKFLATRKEVANLEKIVGNNGNRYIVLGDLNLKTYSYDGETYFGNHLILPTNEESTTVKKKRKGRIQGALDRMILLPEEFDVQDYQIIEYRLKTYQNGIIGITGLFAGKEKKEEIEREIRKDVSDHLPIRFDLYMYWQPYVADRNFIMKGLTKQKRKKRDILT